MTDAFRHVSRIPRPVLLNLQARALLLAKSHNDPHERHVHREVALFARERLVSEPPQTACVPPALIEQACTARPRVATALEHQPVEEVPLGLHAFTRLQEAQHRHTVEILEGACIGKNERQCQHARNSNTAARR